MKLAPVVRTKVLLKLAVTLSVAAFDVV